MRGIIRIFIGMLLLFLVPGHAGAQKPELDETPAGDGEWGYRPAQDSVSRINPPSFTWRPQENLTWEIECARDTNFKEIEYRARNLKFNVHCPPCVFKPGIYTWRYRGLNKNGSYTNWSHPRTFTIARDAVPMPLPQHDELISRIPKTHPRLFVRPENLDRLREMARGELKDRFDKLLEECEKILADPPSVEEPPEYPEGTVRGSDPWREIWWGKPQACDCGTQWCCNTGFHTYDWRS